MAEENVEPLITECPNCQTRFRVTESQLQVAAGRVRCGACLTVFQGVEHLLWDSEPQFESDTEAQSALDELLSELGADPAVPVREATSAGDAGELPDLEDVGNDAISTDTADDDWSEPGHQLYGGHETPGELDLEDSSHEELAPSLELEELAPSREMVLDQLPGQPGEDAAEAESRAGSVRQDGIDEPPVEAPPIEDPFFAMPDFSERAEADRTSEPFTFGEAPSRRRWWVTIATAAALLALVAQVLWYQFEPWSRDPGIRPVYAILCKAFGCELPVLQDLDSLLAQNLVVRSHPEVANALLVDAIIVNQASFVQPFPVLELRFTSLNGNLVAGRRFQPGEYLAGELAGATIMPPRTPIRVELGIEDPGDEAVNYFLTFR